MLDDGLRLTLNATQMRLIDEAFGVQLVDILGAGRPRRKPATRGLDLEPTNRRTVARRRRGKILDALSGKLRRRNIARRKLRENALLFGRRWRIDAFVHGRAEIRGELAIQLAGIA